MKIFVLITIFLCIGLVGCATLEPTPSVDAIETAISETQQANPPTPTQKPVSPSAPASSPEPTDRPLPSPTLSMIATMIAEPKPLFEYAYVYGMAHLKTGHLLITIEVPGDIPGTYQAKVGDEVFDCEILPEYPNRLYCTGMTSEGGKIVQLSIIESRSQITVFEQELGIPPSPYTSQLVETKADKSTDKTQDQPITTPSLPAYPYP